MSRSALPLLALLASLLATTAVAGPKTDTSAGKATYEAQCLICHGMAGDGMGPAGAAQKPAPTDFTTAAWWEGKTDTTIMGAIRRGSAGTSMQAYNKLSREDLENLAAYLQGFRPDGQ